MSQFKDYQSSISYFLMLKNSHKYEELYDGHVAYISIFLTGVILVILYWSYFLDRTIMQTAFDGILTALIGGLLGLLGFLITGLSILVSLITKKAIDKIDDANNAEHLLRLLFSFYFSGSLIAVSIFLSIMDYLILKINLPYNDLVFISLSLVTAYLVVFSILYTVGLLGTCINIFLLNIQWNKD